MGRSTGWNWVLPLMAALLATQAAVQLAMGRVLICTCGTIELWHGEVNSSGNSQHLSDWYTPSHIVHGFLFYGALWLLMGRRVGLAPRALLATLVEVAWEVVENTPMVINRYREATMALGYTGDSVVNSLADVVAMWLGFVLARWLPVWLSAAIVLGLELLALWAIRDNLTLNVLMLLWPVDGIRQWQAGG